MRIKLGNIKVHEGILVSYHGKIKCKWEKLKHMKKSLNAVMLIYKLEKSISPLTYGVGLHNPPTYETVYITP
jgi:hypothetical protein